MKRHVAKLIWGVLHAFLAAVVDHYDQLFDLRLRKDQKLDLIEYLKSL